MKTKTYLAILLTFTCYLQYAASPKRELRGTWIATVANIDWTLSPGVDAQKQKNELIAILDNVAANNMNCIVFQIRPTADAFYSSSYEPWSHWITGEQGKDPEYDPLQFAIDECDKRGIAVHVWINPYRVWLDKVNIRKAAHPMHPYNRLKECTVDYGKSVYLQPAIPRTREYVCCVIAEIVRNYDIDALHIDDYFYPYKVEGEEFPDQREYNSDPRGFADKNDWRRDNVNLIVKQIYDTIKSIKPYVEFGVSPFGVWRNKSADPTGSDTRAGVANYDDLYADILKWQKLGWIDYVAPQLYWQIGFAVADYRVLARWWNENSYGTPVYIGQSSYRINPKSSTAAWRTPEEIVRQVKLNRELPNVGGSIMYSAKSIASPEFKRALKSSVFNEKSLIPENPRVEPIIPSAPEKPMLMAVKGRIILTWQPGKNNRRYVIYRFKPGENADTSNPANIVAITGEESVTVPSDAIKCVYAVTSLSRTNRESDPVFFE